MGTKTETITENIFTKAIHLIELQKYKELDPTDNYNECDALMVNHENKTLWFTTQSTAMHTNKVSDLMDANRISE